MNDKYQRKEFFEEPIIIYYSAFHKLIFPTKESYQKYKDSKELHNELMYELEYKLMFTNNETKEN